MLFRSLIANAMRSHIVPTAFNLFPDNAVSIAVVISRPRPTVIGAALIDFLPKALFDRRSRPDVIVMPNDESKRLTLDVASLGFVTLGNWRGLAASTFAEFCWSLARGILGVHKKFTFLLPKPRTPASVAGHFLLVSTPVSIAETQGFRNVFRALSAG